MNDVTKKAVYIAVCSLILLIFVVLALLTIDNKRIRDIEDFISNDVRVLYVTSNKKNNYPTKLLTKYGIEYLDIDSSELTIFERKKLKKIINNNNIDNILVIYDKGTIIDTLENFKKEKQVNNFFQKNKIIPEKITEDVKEIMNDAMNILDGEYLMVYIPYVEHRDVNAQDQFLKEIASEYSIDYKRIDAYLLSNKQHEKINTLLNISLVDDQVLILIKENKVVANIRGVHRKNTFIENLYDVNFINELDDKINKINFETFENMLFESSKNIIMVGSESTKDSNEIYNLLNKLVYNYDIKVNYINVAKNDSETYNKVKEKLEKIGYEGAYSLPIVLIVESNNVVDYIIGNTKEE